MQKLNQLWSELIIEELIRCGVGIFVLSPGSRCSPLTAAVASNSQAKSIMHYDERGAAFFALGYARATMKPAVLICTSGSAVANYFPAVTEASQDNIPLFVLSADRPPELLGCGANQAIKQERIFGEYSRAFFQIPCPDANIAPEFVLTTIDQAYYRSIRGPRGPVHVNCNFREPLEPLFDYSMWKETPPSLSTWRDRLSPYTTYFHPVLKPSHFSLEFLHSELNRSQKGLIVVGKLDKKEDQQAVRKLASSLCWPVFSDLTSGLRFAKDFLESIPFYDQALLGIEGFPEPDFVLHIGGQSVSKRLAQFLKKLKMGKVVRVVDHPFRIDPDHILTHRIEADISEFCNELLLHCEPRPSEILEDLKNLSALIESVLEEEGQESLHEVAVARLIAQNISDGAGLFLASSLSIRHMDMFASCSREIEIAANRGCSGIDGTIASAAGFARALGNPVTLLIGDLACLHDLNSLVLLRNSPFPVTVVVVNNDGGGIFSFLPIAKCENIFEEFFETPHELSFLHAAKMFDLGYLHAKNCDSFAEGYRNAISSGKSSVIEVFSECRGNRETHRDLQEKIKEALQLKLLQKGA
ncbi:MAG: 2-succinyl-5-enolpyruvyl-6-hydroxy-3-cyclohexene-1-carboxylate synthase [Chlamydiales bacterium]|jgi:2-succinyl-5-enolpyruvyl-6-hydroxy-3-cyclohexene-1-carboxylate synthase